MKKIKKLLIDALSRLCSALFALMVIVCLWQTVSRTVLNSPAAWTEECLTYTFTALVLCAAALVFAKREHMSLSFIVDKFPHKARIVTAVLMEGITAVLISAVFIYGGISISKLTMIQVTPALQIKVGVLYIMLPVTGVLIDLFCILNIVQLLGEIDKK